MHGYRTNKGALLNLLSGEYRVGAQIQIQTTSREIIRGGIHSFEIECDKTKAFRVNLDWLCKKRPTSSQDKTSIIKWELEELPKSGYHSLLVAYRWYYPQPDETRIKVKTSNGEFARIYADGDYTNLVEKDGVYIPIFDTYSKAKWRFIISAILAHTPKPWFI